MADSNTTREVENRAPQNGPAGQDGIARIVERNGERLELHDWYGPDDPDNPFNFKKSYKWILTITVCFVSILTGLPAGSYGAGNDYMESKFHIQNQPFPNLYWATCTWNIGASVLPLLFVPLTEHSGRMPGYFIAYFVFEVFLFGSAFANNFATLVVTRFFGGGGSSVAILLVSGSIADVWQTDGERSLPMSLFGFTSVIGIALGPFIGSAIVQIKRNDPWRWIFYVQIIYNAGFIPIFWFILRETRGDAVLTRRAKKLRKENPGRRIYAQAELDRTGVWELIKISFKRPVRMLFTEPVVLFFSLWLAFAWGILYLYFSSIVQTFSTSYGFGIMSTGLIQLAISVGGLIGLLFNPIQDWIYLHSGRWNKANPGVPKPEARLYTSIIGSSLFTGGLFWYGWTCRREVHWMVPTAAIACTGVGIFSIFLTVTNYLTDSYERYAASAISAAGLARNGFAAFLPFASFRLFDTLGFGWAGSLLGFVGLALTFVPVVLVWKGPQIRARSPFMAESTWGRDKEARAGLGHGEMEGGSSARVPSQG
ncbi:MFS general substrate transporter [Eremomyces bilateralis CBS 781.70]|uniref:MFS general substrate transporter n=1 Tax=Eremomyces bilateralis CBS 781.70 TaxID=1392243 RepID=A0A6G1FYB6_9PEZI|nr:MFS general substrate transporter [Eremomyces bilateralis CBS 781.70]KAF1810758.1 MFS general substrate transporter [Eremomyces bilateralis CBS 781.70]